MKYIPVIWIACAAFLFLSCEDAEKRNEKNRDYSVHYFLDTTASMGTEIIMDYTNGKLISSHILIQEEKKRTMITYCFIKDSIIAQELIYFYNNPLTVRQDTNSVVFGKDLADSTLMKRYILNYDGCVIWREDSLQEINIFYSKMDSLLPTGSMSF